MKVGDDVSLRRCSFRFLGSNNHVEIHSTAKLQDMTFWMEGDGNRIVIGKGTTTHGKIQLAACEGTSIMIGKDCMFSHDIYVRTTDSHPIYNKDGLRINPAEDIHIGDHVWIGMQSLILKGVVIPDGSVVGARSLVNKSFDVDEAIYAGQPAKLVKENMRWERERKK